MASQRLAVSSLRICQRSLQRGGLFPQQRSLRSGYSCPSSSPRMADGAARFFSGKDGSRSDGGSDTVDKKKHGDDDPFGVNFEDGDDHGRLGTTMPPKYKRDAVTGKFTGEKERELTREEQGMLKMDPIQEQEYLAERLNESWNHTEATAGAVSDKAVDLGSRIRDDSIGTNVLGRSPDALSTRSVLDGGEPGHSDKSQFSKPLSPEEFKVFQQHMQDEYDVDVEDGDIPVETTARTTSDAFQGQSRLGGYADNEYLNSKWLSSEAMKFMNDENADDPFADLIPADLNPSRVVNNRKAKTIPRELLHHNNLSLLRRYITPTGQIMNRMHSRLGAKDQRKIAKLVKRARNLGLLPHEGQFAVEAHGNTKEADIHENKEWEDELVRRGLVINKERRK